MANLRPPLRQPPRRRGRRAHHAAVTAGRTPAAAQRRARQLQSRRRRRARQPQPQPRCPGPAAARPCLRPRARRLAPGELLAAARVHSNHAAALLCLRALLHGRQLRSERLRRQAAGVRGRARQRPRAGLGAADRRGGAAAAVRQAGLRVLRGACHLRRCGPPGRAEAAVAAALGPHSHAVGKVHHALELRQPHADLRAASNLSSAAG
jgi:hypothetical protein